MSLIVSILSAGIFDRYNPNAFTFSISSAIAFNCSVACAAACANTDADGGFSWSLVSRLIFSPDRGDRGGVAGSDK